MERIHFVNHTEFYDEHGMLLVSDVMNNFSRLFAPLQLDLRAIRSWGHVPCDKDAEIEEQIMIYEHQCDQIQR